MTHSEFSPVGAYRNGLDELKVVLDTVAGAQNTAAAVLPVDTLKQLSGQAKTMHTESTTAGNNIESGQRALGSASITLANSDRLLGRTHPELAATAANGIAADKELGDAKIREIYCADTADQSSSALAEMDQEMSVKKAEVALNAMLIKEFLDLIAQAEGVLGPPTW